MNWNKWVRQTHRWLSIVFTVAVIINIVAVIQKKEGVWVGLLALFPLILLLLTGLYLFVLPYASKWRSGRGATEMSAKTRRNLCHAAQEMQKDEV